MKTKRNNKYQEKRIKSKHQASKKGFKHHHNLSKGQMKDALKVTPAGK